VNAVADELILEGGTVTLNAVVNIPVVSYLWTPNMYMSNNTIRNPVVTAVNDQLYTLKVTDAAGCKGEDQVYVKVLRPFVIPNTFTPNNDGINDTWIIERLPDYRDCKVQVFNRYGQVVFSSVGYSRPWNGTFNNRTIPFGTYYYIIEPGYGVKPFTGYVTIIK
jgi:gliding motility-associated-like protein